MKHSLKISQEKKGFLYVILAGIAFGFIGVFSRWAFSQNLDVGEVLFWRFLFASTFLGIYFLLFRPSDLKLKSQQIAICFGLGCLGYAVFSSFYFKSIQGLSIPLAAMILFTFPIFVNLGSFFFLKEKLSKFQIISLFVSTLGLGILLMGPVFVNSLEAVGYGFAASISYAIYVLVSSRFQKNVDPLAASFYVMLSASLALYLFHRPDITAIQNYSWQQLAPIFGLSFVCTIAPLSLFLAGMQYIPGSKASVIVMIEPVVATISAWVIFSEKMTFSQSIGAMIVFLGVLINSRDLK